LDDDGFRIEEQKSTVAAAIAARDPKLTFPHATGPLRLG
jgi:hypothetical protein